MYQLNSENEKCPELNAPLYSVTYDRSVRKLQMERKNSPFSIKRPPTQKNRKPKRKKYQLTSWDMMERTRKIERRCVVRQRTFTYIIRVNTFTLYIMGDMSKVL